MIDIAVQAFVLSLPILVAIDKGRMGLAFVLFLVAMMPMCVQFIFIGPGESPLALLVAKWVFWFLGFVYSLKIKSAYQNCN